MSLVRPYFLFQALLEIEVEIEVEVEVWAYQQTSFLD